MVQNVFLKSEEERSVNQATKESNHRGKKKSTKFSLKRPDLEEKDVTISTPSEEQRVAGPRTSRQARREPVLEMSLEGE